MPLNLFRIIGDDTVLQDLIAGLPSIMLLLIVAFCIAVLSKGADWMIDGAAHLARRTGLSRVVIGATIISLGTTTPEAFVSVMAAWLGNPGLALGNGVGSIIADTGLIFGLTCVVARVPISRFILNRTGWVQVGAATLLVVVSVISLASSVGPPRLSRGVGLSFLVLLAVYMYLTYLWAREANLRTLIDESEDASAILPLPASWARLLGGLLLVVAAARFLVPAASEVARRIGVPEDVIAATMVAFGTSLPELMTAIAAVKKGHPEIMVGNIVGADVLNCLFVIGAAAAAKPLEIPPNFFYFHFPAMLVILYSFRLFISINREGVFRKWQGVWLMAVYALYVVCQYTLNMQPAHAAFP
jgi:cation:H+ antiporter